MGTYLSTPKTDKCCESGECIGTVVVIDDEDERHWTDQQEQHITSTGSLDNDNDNDNDPRVVVVGDDIDNDNDNCTVTATVTGSQQDQSEQQRQNKQQKTSHNFRHYRHYDQNVRWGVVDMQGWRKSMEDAHVAVTNVPVPVDLTYLCQQSNEENGDEVGFEATTTSAMTRREQTNAHIFGVFDGHGGAEVARFCALFLVSVLQQQSSWRTSCTVTETTSPRQRPGIINSNNTSNDTPQETPTMSLVHNQSTIDDDKQKNNNTASIGDALVAAFHALDRMIDDPKRRDEFVQLRLKKPRPGEQRIAENIPPPLTQFSTNTKDIPAIIASTSSATVATTSTTTTASNSSSSSNSSTTTTVKSTTTTNAVTTTNITAATAADVSTSDPKTTIISTESAKVDQVQASTSTATSSNNSELQTATKLSGNFDTATNATRLQPTDQVNTSDVENPADNSNNDGTNIENGKDDDDEDVFEDADSQEAVGIYPSVDQLKDDNAVNSWELDNTKKTVDDDDDDDDNIDSNYDEFVDPIDFLVTVDDATAGVNSEQNDNIASTTTATTTTSSQVISGNDDTSESKTINPHDQQQLQSTAVKVSVMLQRLLSLGGQSGQVVLSQGEGTPIVISSSTDTQTNEESSVSISSTAGSSTETISTQHQERTQTTTQTTLCAVSNQPSIVRNGNIFCNLQDHPVHAGATAIVAVLVDRTLIVANAGDSRAVLCRGSSTNPTHFQAIALSLDHKPMQERELSRIRAAGGFVNTFGRVNGNLNLSRSIGDLKYKQVAGIPPERQIITAEPDIKQIQLTDDDEFVVLGCDGIWDCLSNEKAVEFVRERINSKTLTDIGIEMLDSIISVNPQTTQGIGGDNMTILIVDLQPQKRTNVTTTSIATTTTTTPQRTIIPKVPKVAEIV